MASTTKVPALTAHTYFIAVILLLVLACFLGLKYAHSKYETMQYAQGTMIHDQQLIDTSVTEEAKIIANSVGIFPSAQPLYTQTTDLQNYVSTMSTLLQRDIVIVDTGAKILADTVPANRNNTYAYDQGKLSMTLKDGIARSFFETSIDYPHGIIEIAVPMKSVKGTITGAVILSVNLISR